MPNKTKGFFPPINIWTNIEKVYVERIDFIFQCRSIVGIHNVEWNNAILEIDELCTRLQQYKSKLIQEYKNSQEVDPASQGTYIYLIKDFTSGYYKIGRSKNPSFREKTLLSQSPNISTIFISPVTIRSKEKELHKIFSKNRIRGEWFNLTDADINTVKTFNY